MQYLVYADSLLLVNFLLDYALLWGTAHFAHFKTNWRRLFFASFLGAIYGLCILFPQLSLFYGFWGKFAFSLIMLLVAFGFLSWRRFLWGLACFYLISFAMAGAVLGGSSLISHSGLQNLTDIPINITALLFAVLVAVVLGKLGLSKLRRTWQKQILLQRVEISLNGKKAKLVALLDTGNELVDPVSGKPVLVAEATALLHLFPKELQNLFERYGDNNVMKVIEKAGKSAKDYHMRLIPFSSIGKANGLFLGFQPDSAVFLGRKPVITQDLIICLYKHPLGKNKGYNAVVNPMAMQKIEEERLICGLGA